MRRIQPAIAGNNDSSMLPAALDIPTLGDESTLGDREQILRFYREMRVSLYSYLVCVGLRPQDADDILQDAFLRLHRQIRSGEHISEPRAWLFRVARNLSLNLCRDQRRLVYAADPYMDTQLREPHHHDHDPEAHYLKKEALLRLDAGIARLTEQQQHCIHLRAQGLRYREIASILGVSVSSAAELLQRAIVRLAKDCQ